MKTKTTRRNLLGTMCALVVAPFAHASTSNNSAEIISVGDPGAENLECYEAVTEEVQYFVHTIAVGLWVEKYDSVRLLGDNRPRMLCAPDGAPSLRKVYGDFRVRPKPKKSTLFGYDTPLVCDEQVVEVRDATATVKRLEEDLEICLRMSELSLKFKKGL